MGYAEAGFDVFGVDLNDARARTRHRPRPKPLKRYPFPSIEMDALEFLRSGSWRSFDAIHASPPCQAYTTFRHLAAARGVDLRAIHGDLIEPTRDLLLETGLPYVIENVPEAPLSPRAILLCGSMFDPPLDVQRHRLFEANWALEQPMWPCRHKLWAPRFRGADQRGRQEGKLSKVVPVFGGTRYAGDLALRRRAMEIDWMTGEGLNEAIPPRYAAFIGAQLYAHVGRECERCRPSTQADDRRRRSQTPPPEKAAA